MEEDNLNWSIEFFESQPEKCIEALKSNAGLNRVKIVTHSALNDLRDGDLVRYRGMVQDMLNPEYYFSNYDIYNTETNVTSSKSGKYRDVTHFQKNEVLKSEDENAVPEERQVLFCIPVPGLTPWVQALTLEHSRETESACDSTVSRSNGVKRPLADDTECEVDSRHPNKHPELPRECCETGEGLHFMERYCPTTDTNPGSSTAPPCLIKLYHNDDADPILLNDCVEVVGFLSLDPALEATWEDCDEEDKALHPPPSLVPRVHVVYWTKLRHCNPLLDQQLTGSEVQGEMEQVRADLRLVLTQVLCGDHLAADYLLCHLLSRVYTRSEFHTLGHFPLNLFNMPQVPGYGRRLFEMLQTLVTHASYVLLSIKGLNEEPFVPKKDYETNRLVSGRLQLPEGCHLVVDESGLEEGLLRQPGVLNVQAMQTLMRDQRVTYDFGYYPVEYHTNIAVLVLSEGKTILDAGVQLKLQPDSSIVSTLDETLDAAKFFLSGEILPRIRRYLTAMRLLEFDFDEALTSKVAEDYAELRRDGKVTPEDLHKLLVLARLVAVSQGRGHIASADWETAVSMDTERRSRAC